MKSRQENRQKNYNGFKNSKFKPNRDPKYNRHQTAKKETGEREYSADDGIFAMLAGTLPSPDTELSGSPVLVEETSTDNTPTPLVNKQFIYVCATIAFHPKDT